jgi:hypothetical protein
MLYMLCILSCFSATAFAQTRVSGNVVDVDGKAVIGVNVVEKGDYDVTGDGIDDVALLEKVGDEASYPEGLSFYYLYDENGNRNTIYLENKTFGHIMITQNEYFLPNMCAPLSNMCAPLPNMCAHIPHVCTHIPHVCAHIPHVCTPFSDKCAPFSDMCTPFSDKCTPFSDMCTPFSDMCAPFSDKCTLF